MLKRILGIALPGAGFLLSSGCAAAGSFSQSQFDQIAVHCGLPRSALTLQGNDELRFQPPQDAEYEAVDCALQKIKEAKLPGLKMSFVGNERYEPEAK